MQKLVNPLTLHWVEGEESLQNIGGEQISCPNSSIYPVKASLCDQREWKSQATALDVTHMSFCLLSLRYCLILNPIKLLASLTTFKASSAFDFLRNLMHTSGWDSILLWKVKLDLSPKCNPSDFNFLCKNFISTDKTATWVHDSLLLTWAIVIGLYHIMSQKIPAVFQPYQLPSLHKEDKEEICLYPNLEL